MSSSEMLSLIRHICMILDSLIVKKRHQVKWLKTIAEIVLSNTHFKTSYNCHAIQAYLEFHTRLFPNKMKPKHHFLIHYPRVLEKVGVLQTISSMRYESKHRKLKKIAQSTENRINVCHTIALQHQLCLSHRFMRG